MSEQNIRCMLRELSAFIGAGLLYLNKSSCEEARALRDTEANLTQ